MQIATEGYQISYNNQAETVIFSGSLRLNGLNEYTPVIDLLNSAANSQPTALTLDLRQLEFLNSSGINVLSKFVITVRQRGNLPLIVQGNKKIPWQGKSLPNLQRLMPALKLTIEE